MAHRVNMLDIAKATQLSESTVSRALRGDQRISMKTRDRVVDMASTLGYQPNALVSALMTIRRKHGNGRGNSDIDTIALLTDYQGDGDWRSKDVCRWEYEGICQRAQTLGYRVEEFAMADYGHDGDRLRKTLIARGIRGVLLGFSRYHTKEIDFGSDHFTIAGLSAYFHELKVDRANFHGLHNVRIALREMQALGFKRTGLVVPEFNNRISGFQWSSGALDWQRHQTEAERCTPLILGEENAESAFNTWLDQESPDSLLVYKMPVRSWLSRRGLRVPQDINLAYLYRTEEEMAEAPGIDGQLSLVGAAAFDLVVEALHTNRTGVPDHPKEVLIKGTWQAQKSRSLNDRRSTITTT